MPWLQRIEQAVERCLLLPVERDRYFARFNVDALLRGDSTARAGYMQTALRSGWMTVNEARANDNLTGKGAQDPPASHRLPGPQSGITGDDNG